MGHQGTQQIYGYGVQVEDATAHVSLQVQPPFVVAVSELLSYGGRHVINTSNRPSALLWPSTTSTYVPGANSTFITVCTPHGPTSQKHQPEVSESGEAWQTLTKVGISGCEKYCKAGNGNGVDKDM